MKLTTLALTLALAASSAYAQDDFESRFLQDLDLVEEEEEVILKLNCPQRAKKLGDRCYLKSDVYHSKTRDVKLQELWKQLVPDENVVAAVRPLYWTEAPQFFTQKANGSFCQRSDELSRNRTKTTHTQGLVAKVEYVAMPNNGYTGILGSGSDSVIMRLSESNNLHAGSRGLTPSVAFKFLVDGTRSQNIFGMSSFLPSGSWNFFENPLCNRVEPFNSDAPHGGDDYEDEDEWIRSMTFQKKLVEGSQRPFAVGVSPVYEFENDGTQLDQVAVAKNGVPYALRFVSDYKTKSKRSLRADGTEETWYDQVKAGIKTGDTIFSVLAQTKPLNQNFVDQFPNEELGEEIKIGEIRLNSDLYTSVFGDEKLYFQHRGVQTDRRFWDKPWKTYKGGDVFISKNVPENIYGNVVPDTWPTTDLEAAEDKWIAQEAEFGCPFEWLLKKYLPEPLDMTMGGI